MLAAHRRVSPLAFVAKLALLQALFLVALLLSPTATAQEPGAEFEIHLITVGPGEHVYTAGGHAALMVAALRDGVADPEQTLIYNYGDTDFDDPDLQLNLVCGGTPFRLTILGTLQDLVDDYGIRQGRDVWRQKLSLSPAQASWMAEQLAIRARPENRTYRHHYHYATCTTKIRDIIDEATDGAVQRALVGEATSPNTSRAIQRVLFRRHHLMALAGDIFMGRIHDHEVDKYWALVDVPRMVEYLQEVRVPGPDGALVPLAQPPVALIEYIEPDVVEMPSLVTAALSILTMLLVGFGGRRALRDLPQKTRSAGVWLIAYPLLSGLLGAAILAVMLISGIEELRQNENVLVFPLTDLLLVGLGAIWARRPLKAGEQRLLTAYAYTRMVLLIVVVALHVVGVLYQQPLVFIALSFLFSTMLVTVARVGAPPPCGPSADA